MKKLILILLLLISLPVFADYESKSGVEQVGGGGLLPDGTTPLTDNWDVGPYTITGTRFISDIATGTAPFGVSSTTLVSNLNADLLDGKEASAFQTTISWCRAYQ